MTTFKIGDRVRWTEFSRVETGVIAYLEGSAYALVKYDNPPKFVPPRPKLSDDVHTAVLLTALQHKDSQCSLPT